MPNVGKSTLFNCLSSAKAQAANFPFCTIDAQLGQVSVPDELIAPTVVFDEVEAGLGGRAAYLTGLKLRELADHVQVILITHEASIAAMADQHYKVERSGDLSTVTKVEGEERAREIARMLSGRSGDQEALAHARKLLSGRENV